MKKIFILFIPLFFSFLHAQEYKIACDSLCHLVNSQTLESSGSYLNIEEIGTDTNDQQLFKVISKEYKYGVITGKSFVIPAQYDIIYTENNILFAQQYEHRRFDLYSKNGKLYNSNIPVTDSIIDYHKVNFKSGEVNNLYTYCFTLKKGDKFYNKLVYIDIDKEELKEIITNDTIYSVYEYIYDKDKLNKKLSFNSKKNSITLSKLNSEELKKFNSLFSNNKIDFETQKIVDLPATFQGNWIQYLSNTMEYPIIAQDNGIEGSLIIKYIVGLDGEVTGIKAIAGPLELRPEAEHVIRMSSGMWKPAKRGEIPVKAYGSQKITFKLE